MCSFSKCWQKLIMISKLGSNFVLFLEKVATIFGKVAISLPQYRKLLQTCQNRRKAPHTDQERLLKIMSFLYSDIINLCQQMYCLFAPSSKHYGLRQQAQFLYRVMWKPLNKRLADLLVQIEHHGRAFEREIQIDDQAFLTQHIEDMTKYLRQSEHANAEDRAKKEREGKLATGMYGLMYSFHKQSLIDRSTTNERYLGLDWQARVQTHLRGRM